MYATAAWFLIKGQSMTMTPASNTGSRSLFNHCSSDNIDGAS